MSIQQANRYYELAAKARANGRQAIADALMRQAQREQEKEAMDIRDVANIQRERANAQQNVPPAPVQQAPMQQAPVQETPVVDSGIQGGGYQPSVVPPTTPTTPTMPVTPPSAPVVPPTVPTAPNMPSSPTDYKPSLEELANMADSEQFNGDNSPTHFGAGMSFASDTEYPGMDNEGDVIASALQKTNSDVPDVVQPQVPVQAPEEDKFSSPIQKSNNNMIKPIPADQRMIPARGSNASSMRIYDPDVFAGAPPEGDEVWNTPEEQNARMLANKKKQKDIEELAKKARSGRVGEQYWGNNRVY